MKNVFLFLISVIVLPISICVAFAEQRAQSEQLEEITVTATKKPRKVEEVPAAIDVITKEDIEKSKAANIGEVLEVLSGVQAETKNGGYDTHIIIRGAGAKASYGVREIMVMVDGIPITDPDSLTRLDVVDTSLIERIEVVKGPSSTLYGANAAGGVINIITKSPLQYQGFSLRGGYGDNNTQDYHLQYGGNFKNLYFLLSLSRRSTDSWREHNEFETNQFNTRFNYIINDKSDLAFTFGYTKANLQLPGSLTKEQFESNPSQVTSEWPNTARNSEVKRASLEYKKEFSNGNEITGQLYVQQWDHFHPVPMKINDGGAWVYGMELQGNFPHILFSKKATLSAGISGQRDKRDSEAFTYEDLVTTVVNGKVVAIPPFSTSDAEGHLMEKDKNTVDKWGVFIQESMQLSDKALVDLGVRLDWVRFELNEDTFKQWSFITSKSGVSYFNYTDVSETIRTDKTWKQVSPRIGVTYNVAKGIGLYGTISTGFQTPAQSELGTNTDLQPQKAVNYETGLKGRFEGGHTVDIALFYTSITDEVIKLMDNAGATFFDNAGKTVHKGVEVSGKVQILKEVSLGASYTYSDFEFVDFKENEKTGFPPTIKVFSRDGNQLPLVPMHKFSASLNYNHPSGIYARLIGDTWGKYFVDTANTQTYSGFTVFKGRVGYKKNKLSLYVQVDNIFDKRYAAEVTQSYGKISYSPGAPRTWLAGVAYEF